MKYALILLDFINDLVDEDGKAPSCALAVKNSNVIASANSLIELFKHQKHMIVYVTLGFSQNYCELPQYSPMFGTARDRGAFIINTWGTRLFSDLNYVVGSPVIVKHRVSPFYQTNLECLLKANAIEGLVVSGVSTNNAVQTCVRDAHDRDYRVFVAEDACTSGSAEDHSNALSMMKRFSMILKTDELLNEFSVAVTEQI